MYAPQSGRLVKEKQSFYDELKGYLDMHSAGDLVMCLGDFNEHVGRHNDGFDGAHGRYGIGQKNVVRVLSGEGIVCQIHGLREEKRKVTFTIGENERKIDFVLVKKEHQQFIQNVKSIHRHALVIADIDKRKIRKVVRKTCGDSLLKDVKIWKRF